MSTAFGHPSLALPAFPHVLLRPALNCYFDGCDQQYFESHEHNRRGNKVSKH